MILLRLLALLPLLFSCTNSYMGKEVYGADEFVLDSYRIREGKFAILELEGKIADELPADALEEYQDRVHEDDVLQIVLYHPKRQDLSGSIAEIGGTIGYRVSGGLIHLPDLQPIQVAGLTLDEARERIQQLYRRQMADVDIFIGYKDRIVRKVELAGLVSIPSVPVDGRIRLFDVLAKAHVPPEANLFKSYVIREGKLLSVDLSKLLKGGDMTQNIVMRGGDKIYIAEPSAATAMLMGEVGVERVINLPSGQIPLREALALAHGIPLTGDKSYIQIIRGNIASPKIYIVSWEHVLHLPNDSLLLMPGDIVYVAPKPITEWNRFVSQLLPSFSGVEVVGKSAGLYVP